MTDHMLTEAKWETCLAALAGRGDTQDVHAVALREHDLGLRADRDHWRVRAEEAEEVAGAALKECEELRAERDMLAAFRDHWYADDLPAMQRLAMWLDPDPNLPLPNLHRLVDGAMERQAKAVAVARAAEARVAEYADALQRYGKHDDGCAIAFLPSDRALWAKVYQDRRCDCGLDALLSRTEEPTDE